MEDVDKTIPQTNKSTNSILKCFAGVFVACLAVFAVYIWHINNRSERFMQNILTAQNEYLQQQSRKFDRIAKLDSLKTDSALSVEYIRTLRTELARDSIVWKTGAETVMRDTRSLLETHLNSMEHQYDLLSLWAGVLTIVFLIFSFYSIFKIESTLNDAKDKIKSLDADIDRKLTKIKNQANKEISLIVEEAEKQRQITENFNRGYEAYNDKRYNDAIKYYEKVIELHPNDFSNLYNNLGCAYIAIDDYGKATKLLEEAIKINPNDSDFYDNLGNVYSKKEDYNKAIELYNHAIKINPNAIYFYNRGNAYNKKGDYDKAIESYNLAITDDPNDARYYYNLGNVYSKKEDYNKAIESYDLAITHNPNDFHYYHNIGIAYYKKGNYDTAINFLQKALELSSNDKDTKQMLEMIQQQKEERDNNKNE